MQHVDMEGIQYMGSDIVPQIIESNRSNFPELQFEVLDLTRDSLPEVDLIICRDCLVHLDYNAINDALKNIKRSNARYLLTTTFNKHTNNHDIVTGDWRPLNLEIAPFKWSHPLHLIDEKCTENDGECSDKMLALWKIEDLPDSIHFKLSK